jgi:hypothetical protein
LLGCGDSNAAFLALLDGDGDEDVLVLAGDAGALAFLLFASTPASLAARLDIWTDYRIARGNNAQQ